MRKVELSDYNFNRLKEGKHVCINGVYRFEKLKCFKEDSEEFILARVSQIGGIFTYDCSIVKL